MRQQVVLGQISAAGLLLLVSGAFYGRVFDGPGWIPGVLGGLLLSALLGVFLGRAGMPRVLRFVALAFAGVLFVLLAVILPTTNFAGVSDLIDAFVDASIDGWRNSLAATPPIDSGISAPLGFVTILAWATGSVTGAMIGRSEQSAAPVVPPVLFAALSLPLAAPAGVAAYVLIAALVGAALLLALVRAVPEATLEAHEGEGVAEFVGERMLTERLISGAPVLLVLGLLAPVVAAALPGGPDEPFDPRRLRVEEVQSTSAVNPLAEIKRQRQAADPAFLLTLPAAPSATIFDRMGLVALESYDGANWTTSSTYGATSADLDPGFALTVETLEVRQLVEITTASLPWVPAGQRPIRIEADDVWYDQASGTLLSQQGPREFSYEVVSEVAVPSAEDLLAATVDRSDPRYLDLPTIPADSPVNLLGGQLTGDSDFERLTALETFLNESLTLVVDDSSGTSIGRIGQFLRDQEGYRDQFIGSFAVAARQQGFPTRIMVGYRIAEETDENTTDFLGAITSAQYDAWPEVLFDGIGWVSFDPVPGSSGEGTAGQNDATTIPEGRPVSQGPTPREADPSEDDSVDDEDSAAGTTLQVVVVSGLFLVLFPIMLMLLVFLLKVFRRRWRENLDDPTARVLAGWQESKDRLLEAGVEIRPDMTVKEIVSASRRELGVHASSSLSTLAPHVTSTIYAQRPPAEETGNIVWDEVELFDRQLNESRTRLQKLRAKVDPRPLLEVR